MQCFCSLGAFWLRSHRSGLALKDSCILLYDMPSLVQLIVCNRLQINYT